MKKQGNISNGTSRKIVSLIMDMNFRRSGLNLSRIKIIFNTIEFIRNKNKTWIWILKKEKKTENFWVWSKLFVLMLIFCLD